MGSDLHKRPKGYTLAAFEKFCRTLVLEDGTRMRLEDFEREALRDHFEGAVETVIVIPKKNGKTTLLAALALFHLKTWPDAEVPIVASSRDQARVLARQASGLVRRSQDAEHPTFVVRPGIGEIRLAAEPKAGSRGRMVQGDRDGARIRIMAAEAGTADGIIPTLALVDELHRHPDSELYGVIRDGLGPRNGQMVTISTAGSNLDSPLGKLRTRAHRFADFTRDAARRKIYARSDDGSFVLHEWALEPTDDPDDMAVVKLVNPAPWQTVAELQRRHDSPSTTPWQWARFACGIWTEGEEPWIEPAAWDRLADSSMAFPDDAKIYLGVDLGVRHDTTAIVIVALDPAGRLYVKAQIMQPGKDVPIGLSHVEGELRKLAKEYRVEQIAYDPWSFRRSAELLEADGLPMLEFPQSPERMGLASANLYSLIDEGRIRHNGDPAFRAQVVAGVTKETERGWRLQKDPKMRRPIDALIALAMAAHTATTLEEPQTIVMVGYA